MPKLNPSTLQAARLSRGLSLSSLAEICGLSSPTLSRLENGTRESTEEESVVIAAALEMPLSALCRSLVSERLGLSGFYHRKLSKAGSRAVSKIENQCVLDVVAISELIGMIEMDRPESVPTIYLDEFKGDQRNAPERAADMIRLKWGIGRGPIRDIFAVVERAGCLVIHTDFGIPEMDAMYQKVRGVPPIFWVNSRKPLDRIRFSVAHELGHLILHEESPVDEKLAEEQADAFAAAFLMPRSDFRGECPMKVGIPQLVEMKRRWRCSMAAIARRAFSVGRITEQQYRWLSIQFSKKGWRKSEPYPLTGESPALLASLVKRAMRDCEFDEDGLAAHLAVPAAQIRSWLQPFVGDRPSVEDPEPILRLAEGY